MAYAIVESGGKQYIARSGEIIEFDRLSIAEGGEVAFDKVLLLADNGSTKVGQPHLEGAQVVGHVVEEIKGPKVRVFKYRPKLRYRRRQGHRQHYTRVMIDEIQAPGQAKKAAAKPEPVAEAKPPAAEPAPKTTRAKSAEDKAPARTRTAKPAAPKKAGGKSAATKKSPAEKKPSTGRKTKKSE
jgi:large subunit ribosomal protein L21